MTFSVVARDPATGDLGVAVESKYLAVGAVVPYGRSDAGILATQFFANPMFAQVALGLLAERADPRAVLTTLLTGDPHRVRRQLVVMRADGEAAAFTGEACIDHAGSVQAPDVVCSGNTLASGDVLPLMLACYEASTEPFWYRLVSALAAGQAAGGDRNGQQSASLLVLRAGAGYGGYSDRMIDLRVDDHPEPIAELRRLADVWARSVIE